MTVLPLETEVATYLQAQGLSLTMGTNLFVGQMPDSPDQLAAISTRPGMGAVRYLTGGVQSAESKLDQPALVIRVRASTYVAGETLIQAIYGKLQGICETTITSGGQLIHLIRSLNSPSYVGVDVQQRHQWTQSFMVQYENGQR